MIDQQHLIQVAVRIGLPHAERQMNEERFWSFIEKAWEAVGGMKAERKKLTGKRISEDVLDELADSSSGMVEALREELSNMTKEDLLAFDRILERKLFDIDRSEIQQQTDGSDDGFLYARGFIVAAGKDYYDAVNSKPATAKMDMECEDICYVSWHIYEERFGKMPDSGISRESCSNTAGWPDL